MLYTELLNYCFNSPSRSPDHQLDIQQTHSPTLAEEIRSTLEETEEVNINFIHSVVQEAATTPENNDNGGANKLDSPGISMIIDYNLV